MTSNGIPFATRPVGQGTEENPFRAPAARVEDVSSRDVGELIDNGRSVPVGNAVAWIGRGWELFKLAPGVWIGMLLALFVLMIALSFIPVVSLLTNFVGPIFMGGIMLGCKALDEGEPLEFAHLLAGFTKNTGNLVLVGVFYMLGIVLIVALAVVVGGLAGGAAAISGMEGEAVGGQAMMMPLLIGGLIGLLLGVPLAMAFWFAPALVVIHDVPAFSAMKMSFFACVKNILPFLVYGLVFLVLAVLAVIPLGLGLLVLGPVMYGSMYASYRDMFVR
jgi:uncharacterized membrane protein